MGQRKKELIALRGAGQRKGGRPADPCAKVVYLPGSPKKYMLDLRNTIKAIGNRIMVIKAGEN